MKPKRRQWSTSRRLAATSISVGIVILAWSAHGAIVIEPVPRRSTQPADRIPPPAVDSSTTSDTTALAEAISMNPFSPQRRPPDVPFRISSRHDEAPSAPETALGPTPELMGIARHGEDSFVLASFPGVDSRLVRPGEKIGGWVLDRIRETDALFRSPGGAEVIVAMPRY